MPPRITAESNRPRVSDRTMVANLATTTLVRFKKTKGGVTITSMKPLGMGTRCLAAGARRTYDDQHHGDRCTQGWGLDARKYPRPSCGRGKMSLDIPFYRTRVTGRGRDSGYPLPPAQTRAGAASAHGSYLGCLASKRTLGYGCSIWIAGSWTASRSRKRSQVQRLR